MTTALRTCLALALLAGSSAPTFAQGTTPANAVAQKLDNDKALVTVATFQPHVPLRSPNGHPNNRVLIYLDAGSIRRQEGTGPAQTRTFTRGDVEWQPASGTFVAENIGSTPIRILVVDLKTTPSGPAPTTALDAPVVDPKRYAVVLDNPQTRVLRVHFEPHDVGARHEHMLNRIVVYMNDQGARKADDVGMSGPAVHVERNDTDTPQDRIAVELK